MFWTVAAFELRYQTRQPVFWMAGGIFFLLAYLMMAVSDLPVGGGGNVYRNAPVAIALLHLSLAMYFMFASTAFVANGVVRDEDTGFGPLIRTTGVSRASYLFGRFAGGYAAAAICFLAVPLGLFAGIHSPWLDPETVGPGSPFAYLYGYVVLALPTLFVSSAILFAVASATRSMMASYIAVFGLFAATVILGLMVNRPEWRFLMGLLDPFGARAFGYVISYWTAAERNGSLPPLGGVLLYNRLIWMTVALALLAGCWATFRFGEGARLGRQRRDRRGEAEPADLLAVHQLPRPHFGAATAWAQLAARIRHETRQIFRSVSYYVLILVGLIYGAATLWVGSQLYGTSTLPVTHAIITLLIGGFSLAPIIIAIFYAGELVWRDRERNVHAMVDAMPFPDWTFLAPKIIALCLVLWTSLAISVPLGIGAQLVRGFTDIRLDQYLAWYLLPQGLDFAMLATLAVVMQTFAPNKYTGWALVVSLQVAFGILGALGYGHNLYVIGGAPAVPLSDMNGQGRFWLYALWFKLYWSAFLLVLAIAAFALWRRGVAVSLGSRLALAPGRLRSGAGAVGALALVAFIGLGGFIFYNTNILNTYRSGRAELKLLADYEKTLLRYENTPQPTVASIRLDLDLHPHQHRLVATGEFILVNRTVAPLTEVHVRAPDPDMPAPRIVIAGARLARQWPRFGYRIYRFDRPMAPGETRGMSFTTVTEQRGFANDGGGKRLVDNGTFISNAEFEPMIGMSRMGLIQNRRQRRKYGLPPDLHMARLDEAAALNRPYLPGGDWVMSDITVTTDADQIPVAPGYVASDQTAGGRRTVRFVSDSAIIHFFAIQSARYAVTRQTYKGIDLAVYHHPGHSLNVGRMINALKAGLDYDQANFGPYQFRQARIVEFPDYATYAQSFANTMAYSEGIGFIADTRDPARIDYPTYVTAHELAHQWWAHQIIGADVQGATVLSETLAQYSALMAMEKLYGPDRIRRFLKYELDTYLMSRRADLLGEAPLDRVEASQTYIHYQKGGLVLYLLRNELGEEAVNAALRSLLAQYRFKGAPYPRSLDLVATLRAQARPDEQDLITDLLERITLYDVRIESSQSVRRPDGRYDVAVTVRARKLYADAKGRETEAPLKESFDIGLFAREPGLAQFDPRDVLLLQRRPLHSGLQTFAFVAERNPTFVGVDPYNKWIDRDSDDNVLKTGLKAGEQPRRVDLSAAMRAASARDN